MPQPLANAALRDPRLPAVELLLGDTALELLQAAVAPAGARITAATPTHVTWWPGRSITVRYRAHTDDDEMDLVATAGRLPDGALVVEGDGARIGVWRLPNDPVIPGLAAALDPFRAQQLLTDLGTPEVRVATRIRAYRPGNRAVVEVRGERAGVFLKLVPPPEVEELHRHHRFLADHLPVPHSLGFDRDLGILALQALPGRTLRRALDDGETRLPGAAELDALLGTLPDPTDDMRSRSPIQRMPRLAELLTHLLPAEADRIARLTAEIGDEDVARSVPSHGDFYEAQLLVGDGAIVGMLDIDTFGWGRPGDDPATMLGHLSVRAAGLADPQPTNAYAGALLRAWDSRLDPVDLRRRVAAVVIGLATGPFRVQRADWPESTVGRIGLAERWAESARRVDERRLIDASAASHPLPGS